jgi:epoxyqueuosine reductase QueG
MHKTIRETIESAITAYSRENQINDMWKEPIFGIISADNDKIYSLKNSVSAEHLLPKDILSDAKSIISFFIPFSSRIINSNISGLVPSEEWALSYIKTNDLIKMISNNIEILMENNGYKAGKIPATHNFDKVKLISNWSHRHIAIIAGLGTFGINNMLITKYGCCGRLGSIITNFEFQEYNDVSQVNEKCLHKKYGNCGVCIKRCMVNAYDDGNFDRQKCYKRLLENAEHRKKIGKADVCGKCLVGLPCSIKEP